MIVEFLEKFSKDIDRINQPHVKDGVVRMIKRVEAAKSFSEIPHTKKLSGHKSAYRIRVGDYRIGIFLNGQIVQFARVVDRKDIYKLFP
jgi:mRNA interferase RelE/StbE